jgi:predicted outer membrane repeat protein
MNLRRSRVALLPLAPAVALVAALASAGPVHALGTTINVTTVFDGAGSCADATHCSTLRAAVKKAASGDIIKLPAGTYRLGAAVAGSHSILIEKALTIQGASAATTIITRDCAPLMGRLITVDPDALNKPVVINDVTLTNGQVKGAHTDGDGIPSGGALLLTDMANVTLNRVVVSGNQAIGNGGGISVHDEKSSLTVNDSIIKNNAAGSVSLCEESIAANPQIQAPIAHGGGVWGEGKVTLASTSVAVNTATGNGGGLLLSPFSGTTDTLNMVFIRDNTAKGTGSMFADVGGGGIYDEMVSGAHVDIVHSTISNNKSPGGSGGGIYEDFSFNDEIKVAAKTALPSGPSVNITATTFNGNTAANNGGGVYVHGSNVAMLNDTFTGNTATNGGAIGAGAVVTPNSKLSLENLTIDANIAKGGRGGGLWLNHDDATVHNTILSGNTKTLSPAGTENCFVALGSSLTSKGYNLANDTTCNLTKTGDQLPPLANAALGVLQNNGGLATGGTGNISPTLTQLLGTGSTALDRGDVGLFPSGDERNLTRAQGPRSDIGAVEMAVVATVTTPTPTPSPTSATLPLTGAVKGIISVPKTGGGGSDPISPIGVALAAALAGLAVSAVVVRRRHR